MQDCLAKESLRCPRCGRRKGELVDDYLYLSDQPLVDRVDPQGLQFRSTDSPQAMEALALAVQSGGLDASAIEALGFIVLGSGVIAIGAGGQIQGENQKKKSREEECERDRPAPIPRPEPRKRDKWRCTAKPRGKCPSQCQQPFTGYGRDRDEAYEAATKACGAAGCHTPRDPVPTKCDCGHVTCHEFR